MATKKKKDEGRVYSALNDGLINLAGDVDRYLQRIERGDQDGIRHERENMEHRISDLKELLREEKL